MIIHDLNLLGWTTFMASRNSVKEVEERLPFRHLWLAELFLTHLTYFSLLFSSSSSFHKLSPCSPPPQRGLICLVRPFDPSILRCVMFELPHCASTSACHAAHKQTWNLDLAIKAHNLVLYFLTRIAGLKWCFKQNGP